MADPEAVPLLAFGAWRRAMPVMWHSGSWFRCWSTLLVYGLVYGAALLLTKFLNSPASLHWLVGLQPQRGNSPRLAVLTAAEPDLSIGNPPAISR